MNSQDTLIDLPELSRATTRTSPVATKVLQFSEHDTNSTKISVSDQPSTHYVVHSASRATRVVRIADGAAERVGEVQRRTLLPDLLTVGAFEMRLGQWLRMPLLYAIPATMHVRNATYTWRFQGWNKLQLHNDSQPVAAPIAWFDRSHAKQDCADGRSTVPTISISEQAEDMMDEIVLAVAIIEHRLRSSEAQ